MDKIIKYMDKIINDIYIIKNNIITVGKVMGLK